MLKYLVYFFRGAYKIPFYYPRIVRYSINKDKYPLEKRYAFVKKLANIVVKALGIKYKVEGLEHLKAFKGGMVTCNHQSFLDAVSMIYLFDNPIYFLSKKESRKYPLAGRVIYFLDALFLDREDLRESVKVLRKCKEYMEEGKNVVIFPEGTRTRDPNYKVGEFKGGSFKPAMDSKSDILPMIINNSYKPLYKKYKGTKYTINVKILPPLTYEEYKDYTSVELARKLEDITKKELANLN